MKRELILNIDGEEVTVTAVREGESIHVEREGTAYRVRIVAESIVGVQAVAQYPTGSAAPTVSGAPSRPTPTGASSNTVARRTTDTISSGAGSPSGSSTTGASSAGQVVAPMTGVIDQVVATEGGAVAEGDVVIILEAMKMYIDVVAPVDGTVGGIAVKPGDQVKEGAPLLTIG